MSEADSSPLPTAPREMREPAAGSIGEKMRCSITAKILAALLAVSLLPLFLFVVVSRTGMIDAQDRIKTALIANAKGSLLQLAEDHAVIADAMLSQVDAETRLVANATRVLLSEPSRGRDDRSGAAADDSAAGLSYTLPPDMSFAAARPELARYSALDPHGALNRLFTTVRAGDSKLSAIYVGTASGILLAYPKIAEKQGALAFTLDATALATQLQQGGSISTELRELFRQNRITLSQQSRISGLAPGRWLIRDVETERIFSVRRTPHGLDVYREYDPRVRSWYLNAANGAGVVWAKYADWNSPGQHLFSLDARHTLETVGRVSPSLVQAFASQHIAVSDASTITLQMKGKWRLQDTNGKNFEIREEGGALNVYSIDILTCTLAVQNAQGEFAGAVGLDVPMNVISGRIIHTPVSTTGYAFLLNERGELIEQEKPDMFIPAAGSDIRRKMTAGGSGVEFDQGQDAFVFYAPIRSIHSADGKSFWSIGITMPQMEITRLADDIQHLISLVLNVSLGMLAIILVIVIYAARRTSRGITGPILALDEGAARIGNGELDYRLDVRTGDEVEKLANAFNKMAADLKIYIKNLEVTTAEKERFASELRVAHEIQMSFLKKIFPPFPDRDDLSLYAMLEPAREVGGDLFDFGFLDENRLVFYVGDVSDKGVPAALVMAMTMTLMKRAGQQPGATPARILREVNQALAEDNENAMFVTLFIGILDAHSGELSFSNAGHNPPLILGANGNCRYLTLPDGMVLGVMPEAKYTDDSVRLEPGDMIVTYTDGVTEAMNPERALYSEERLQQTVAALSGRGVEEAVAAIIASVKTHAAGAPQSDDITVLALKRSMRP